MWNIWGFITSIFGLITKLWKSSAENRIEDRKDFETISDGWEEYAKTLADGLRTVQGRVDELQGKVFALECENIELRSKLAHAERQHVFDQSRISELEARIRSLESTGLGS